MKVRVKFSYVDAYTWEVKRVDKVIDIRSEQAAVKWVRQSYHKAMSVQAEQMEG